MSDLQKKLGNLLKTERERLEITIGDIAEKLKISESNLAAIEEGDISKLPSEIYFNLFSKTYAEALGLDYASIMDQLKGEFLETEEKNKKAATKKKAADSTEDEDAEEAPKQKNFVKTAGFAFGGIVVVFVLFLLINKFFLKSDEATMTDGNQGTNSEEIQKKTDSEMEALYADYDWESVVYEQPEKLTLTLISTEQCWSAIFADGDTALYQNLRPNRLYTIEADYRILVSVGLPSKVTIKLNGTDVDLRNPETRRIYKVLINQLNYKEYINPKADEEPTSPPATSSVTPEENTGNEVNGTGNDTTALSPNNENQTESEF